MSPGSVFELRLLGDRKGRIDSGYFDDPAQAANAIVASKEYYKGIYMTPNPVMPDLLARSANRITPYAQVQTHDPEISRRRWLLVDIDPRRPAGISSSDPEHNAAIAKGRTIAGMLSIMYGFCDPMINDSGNGCHLMYSMDEENSIEVRDEIQTFLKTLKVLYDDDTCEVDTQVFNAARIWRVPGTWARKGDSVPTRPHRRSQVLRVAPRSLADRISIVQLIQFNASHKELLQNAVPQSGPQMGRAKSASEYPADETIYKRLNEYALRNVQSWVKTFFPDAYDYKEGFRVKSADIGQPHEEDLTIHPWPMGIKYFGIADQGEATEGRRTPVSVIAEFALHCSKAEAAQKLSDACGMPVSEFGDISQVAPPEPAGHGMDGLMGGTKGRYDFKNIRTVADLQKMQFKDIRWVVKGVLPAGNMLLAARPKMRKTWLALQLSIAIASGRKFLDWETEKGDVLFLALEDNERRIRSRIDTLQKFEMVPPDLSGFRYWTGGMGYDGNGRLRVTDPEEAARTLQAFPRGEAGVDALEQYLELFPGTSTIIIDTLAHFRGERLSRDIYQSDYESMMPLTKLAARKRVLIIPVMHEKKGNADRGIGGDFLEDVTGSAGITGGSDGVISIKGRRGVQEETETRKLLISGRDVPYDYSLDLAFDAERGGWLKAAREDAKTIIRTMLGRHPYMNQKELQSMIPNVSQTRLLHCLMEMKMEGEVEHNKFGYSLRKDI